MSAATSGRWLLAQWRGGRNNRRSLGKQIGAAAGEWRIDALVIDRHLGRLGGRSRRGDLAVPSRGVERAPGAEVEHGDVPVDVKWKHRLAEQVCYHIVTGK